MSEAARDEAAEAPAGGRHCANEDSLLLFHSIRVKKLISGPAAAFISPLKVG
jgi:hypothetical protein